MAKRFSFNNVSGLKPHKTMFNLKHENITNLDFGEIVPVSVIECLPGDFFDIKVNVVGRLLSALHSPILSTFDVVYEAFFCPTRLLMGSDANFEVPVGECNWEEFLVGGKSGDEDLPLPTLRSVNKPASGTDWEVDSVHVDGLTDCFGVQLGIELDSSSGNDDVLAFFHRMYRFIWNEFYRNEFLQDEIQVCQFLTANPTVEDKSFIDWEDYDKILHRGWRRDYFTSALPFQQFGTSPAFQLEGSLPVEFTSLDTTLNGSRDLPANVFFGYKATTSNDTLIFNGEYPDIDPDSHSAPTGIIGPEGHVSWDLFHYRQGYVNLQNAVTFDISDIRTNFQIQKWMERNARGGVRYTEYLRSHFGVAPSDARLQRPAFIGSTRAPWLVSEVLQTSSSVEGSDQGNQAGQAICVGRGRLGKFRCYEFGYIMIFASVVPKALYQQGIPRMMTRKTRFDFYSPEFAHLSEQAVLLREIFASNEASTKSKEFGFQEIWNELRYIPSRVTRHMRTDAPTYSFDYWHQARFFNEAPLLNSEFLQIGATDDALSELHRIFAVDDELPFVLDSGLLITASRPIPFSGNPGLVDHF